MKYFFVDLRVVFRAKHEYGYALTRLNELRSIQFHIGWAICAPDYRFLSLKLKNFYIIEQELDHVVEELEKIAVVNLLQHRSIISLIGNVQHSSLILEKVRLFCVGNEHCQNLLSSFAIFLLTILFILCCSGIQCVSEEQHQCTDDLPRSI